MTTFGTRIPGLLFEQIDQRAVDVITEDLTYVFASDPRVLLKSLLVTPVPENSLILAQADLHYVELNVTEPFILNLSFQ